MSRKSDADKTKQQKRGLSDGIKFKITETMIYKYMENPGKAGKVLNEELDDRNMKQVPLQDFFLWIKENQGELGEHRSLYSFDKSRDKRGYRESKKKTVSDRYVQTPVGHKLFIGTLFEFLDL